MEEQMDRDEFTEAEEELKRALDRLTIWDHIRIVLEERNGPMTIVGLLSFGSGMFFGPNMYVLLQWMTVIGLSWLLVAVRRNQRDKRWEVSLERFMVVAMLWLGLFLGIETIQLFQRIFEPNPL
jgi:hypothetical protein